MASELEKFAGRFAITEQQLKALMGTYTSEDLFICLELLKAKKFKSTFRESLALQLRLWLLSPESRLKPLSKQQLNAAKPKWPITYEIPK